MKRTRDERMDYLMFMVRRGEYFSMKEAAADMGVERQSIWQDIRLFNKLYPYQIHYDTFKRSYIGMWKIAEKQKRHAWKMDAAMNEKWERVIEKKEKYGVDIKIHRDTL